MDLGKKIVIPPPEKPEWRPHPTDPRFEVNTKGQLRTKIDPPSTVDIEFFLIP